MTTFRQVLSLLGALPFLLLGSLVAFAYHTETERQTDFSADTLPEGMSRLGLFALERGVHDRWTIGTYTLPWLIMPFTQAPSLNVYTKVKLIETGKFAASIRGSYFYVRLVDVEISGFEQTTLKASVIPTTGAATYRFTEQFSSTLEGAWVQMILSGDLESTSDSSALGAGAQSNLQFAWNSEYRLNSVTALNLVTRWVPYVTPARVNTTAEVDSATSAEIEIDASAKAVQNAWQIQPSVTFSWKIFNLQFGLGYGNFMFPGLKIVGAQKVFMPDLDFYFRF